MRWWDLTKLKDALENLALKDIKTRNVRRRSITPSKEELTCLTMERGESSRTRKHTSKLAKKARASVSVKPHDISASDEDEIPISKLDFNTDISVRKGEAAATSQEALPAIGDQKILQQTEKYLETKKEKLQFKEKDLEMKEKELEMKEKKMQEAAKKIEMKKKELDIKITMLEEKLSEAETEAHKWKTMHGEAENEAQKWKAMHGEEVEMKNKLEAEISDMIGVDAMRRIDNEQLDSAITGL